MIWGQGLRNQNPEDLGCRVLQFAFTGFSVFDWFYGLELRFQDASSR